MDAALYDEFGNYIGPELDASDSDGDRESDGEVRVRVCACARVRATGCVVWIA
jgi:hypothetical protein